MIWVVSLVSDVMGVMVSGFCGMKIWNWFVPTIFDSGLRVSSSLDQLFEEPENA